MMGRQWHQLDHMQIIRASLQTDNHTMPVPHHSVFLQAGCPSCHPTNSVKALKNTVKSTYVNFTVHPHILHHNDSLNS